MTNFFPVTHSTLSAEALKTDVWADYGLNNLVDLKLLTLGLNDTYVITTIDAKKYILRIYRAGWRSSSDIAYEIEVLNHLSLKGILVAKPIPQKDGQFIKALLAPEGQRYAVLFNYAEGQEAPYEKELETKAFNYGRGAAKIHQATENFSSSHSRFSLDLDHLLDTPLKSILPMLSHRQEDGKYLQQLAEKIRNRLLEVPSNALEQGFCHGDFHGGNANFADDGTITFYDFDSGGWGWRAYDISVFRWSARLREKEIEFWEPFLRGYTEERPLKDLDLQTVPLFIGLRHFFLLGLHTSNGQDWGFGWINDKYFDKAVKFLQAWEAEYLS